MDVRPLLDQLFSEVHYEVFEGQFFSGIGLNRNRTVAFIGTIDAAPIGVELAHRMAAEILRIIRDKPGWPILLLVDTEGQRLSRRDELLGINGYMAHLAKCIGLARQKGHRTIGLVYSQAVSGGFLASSLLADRCYALPEGEVRVMNLPAMSRVTKIPLATLEALSSTSPIFAPGVENYLRMGAIEKIWIGKLSAALAQALEQEDGDDNRRLLGERRQGRMMARQVSENVRHADA